MKDNLLDILNLGASHCLAMGTYLVAKKVAQRFAPVPGEGEARMVELGTGQLVSIEPAKEKMEP
jgi:hypothetical protein